MFIVAQLPFGDFRLLVAGGMGRLTIPDWTSDNLDSGFVRGFGKISPRNGSSFGLGGERAFADMDRAVRFVEHLELQQEGWDLPLNLSPWFRRLYVDGYMSGRFEFGFMVNDFYETLIFDGTTNTINPSLLAQTILSANIVIKSIDRSRSSGIFANCAKLLGYAYISATTNNAALDTFPVSDTFESAVFVGKPMLHIRISSGTHYRNRSGSTSAQ